MPKCEHCGHQKVHQRLTAEQFKQQFKVGDIIRGFTTRKRMLITGFGDYRFFYKNIRSDNEVIKGEHVASMTDRTARWEMG